MTLVSVVVPTKNRSNFVVAAVKSVFAGTYPDFELFVIDQSEDDATREALFEFNTDMRFHYCQNRRPGYGAASSRNIGIALSSGEIIANIDDDVTVPANWMAKIVEEFETDPNLQFMVGSLIAPPYDKSTGFIPETIPSNNLSNWRLSSVVAGANISMRRTLFDKIGGYDEFCGPGSRLRASDDGDIALRIMRSGAKWKPCSYIEVIHTHGFKPGAEGSATLQRYQFGNGGNYGRQFRRGDFLVGLWFLVYTIRQLFRATSNVLRRQSPYGFDWIWLRLKGFWKGFWLPPAEGFVTAQDLARLRREFQSSSTKIIMKQS